MDIESGKPVSLLPKRTFKKKILLFLRTFIHTFYIVIHMVVLGEGLKVILTLTEEELKNPLISNIKWYSSAYGTNWNYVSYSQIIVYKFCFLFNALPPSITIL